MSDETRKDEPKSPTELSAEDRWAVTQMRQSIGEASQPTTEERARQAAAQTDLDQMRQGIGMASQPTTPITNAPNGWRQ